MRNLKFRHYLSVMLLLCFCQSIFSQSNPSYVERDVYHFSYKKDLPIFIGSAGAFVFSYFDDKNESVLTAEDIAGLDIMDINGFDRDTYDNRNPSAARLSDWGKDIPVFAPLLFLASKKSRSEFGDIMSMYFEAVALNGGVTWMTKSLVDRKRPYVYNPEVPLEDKMTKNATHSFFSGHTSQSAVSSFFFASVYEDIFVDSKWKPLVWAAAITIPAATGYLRVKSGNHFPTDCITGYAVGASIGYFVPKLHKNKRLKENGYRISAKGNGMSLTYTF